MDLGKSGLLMEKICKYNQETYITFVELEKVTDNENQ